ncbi:MAG: hypothetical protein JWP09_682 [Candidatus Taylorbacteria bacterium]|nr:hypothetical protein [Candidatus Taylorbacteria bacterium]
MEILYKNKKWIIGASRNCSFLQQVLFSGYVHTVDFGAPPICRNGVVTIDGTKSDITWEEEGMVHFANGIVDMSRFPKKIDRLERKYYLFAKSFLKSVELLNKKITPKSLDLFLKQNALYSGGLFITLIIGRAVFDALYSRLKELGYVEIDDMISILSYPENHTPLAESRIELYKIGVKEYKEEKKLDQELYKWLLKFQHIPVNYCEDPWDLGDARKQLKESGDNPKDLLKQMELNHKERVKNKKALLKKINDDEVSNFSYALAKGTTLNEFRKNVFCKVSLEYRPAFQKIGEMAGSTEWRDCFYLLPSEIKKIVDGKKVDIKKIKDNRKEVGVIFKKNGEPVILSRSELELFLNAKKVIPQNNAFDSNQIIKGTVANKGKVTGKVKVVSGRSEFGKFERGDILVATMTSVDFVPIMEMAAAFVTNEGGITSHASIVAREMNKPCIIGTKIATKVLKDGDVVEVDAEKGIIRIIK